MEKDSALSGIDFSAEVNLARYIKSVSTYPILDIDEEFATAKKYQETKDKKLAYKLITSHLRLVIKIAATYKGYGLPMSELIGEGNLGLLYAVDKFEPDKGFRFSTYALWWIKAYIQKYILNSWSLVKIGTTAAQKKLFFNLRKIKNRLNIIDGRDLQDDALLHIADSLAVSVQDVKDMNNRLHSHDSSLNKLCSETDDDGAEWLDFLADSKPNPENSIAYSETYAYRKKLFTQALSCLNTREHDILFKRRMQEEAFTLDELSRIYGISKERIRQIELNSIRKIRKNLSLI
ncbi:MAG: RNA polymerase sigma factor RpoH [Alphaproteobacteria bacterium]|nr:RNA polymerase sigma factor RpoH [Alphaproteobacteria bacterium]